MIEIKPPTTCPSCGATLEWSNHLLYCKNLSCTTKAEKKIQHFAKTLKIKGLGPASIVKININSVSELYLLTEEFIADSLSSELLAEKLVYEIENSKNAPLNLVLPAFGIPLVGRSASEKLSKVCSHIEDISEKTCRAAGLGPKATENLMEWYSTEYPLLKDLPFSFKFECKKPTEVRGTICISGKLKSYKTKAEAAKILEELGYMVKPSLTRDVTILVNESGIESAKTRKARDSGITLVTNLKDFIGD